MQLGAGVRPRIVLFVDPHEKLHSGALRIARAARVFGVQDVRDVRVRWLGHRLEADLAIVVDASLPTASSHAIAEAVRHALFHVEPKLRTISVHVDPASVNHVDPHATTSHHRSRPLPTRKVAI